MQAEILQQFFLEEIDLLDLQELVQEELERPEDEKPTYHYTFADMDSIYVVEPYDLVRLCDGVLGEILDYQALPLLAGILNQAEKYEWEDELVTEVLYFWLEPEDDYALDKMDSIKSFRRWLKGEEPIPA